MFATTGKRWSQGKEHKPEDNATDMASAMGIELEVTVQESALDGQFLARPA